MSISADIQSMTGFASARREISGTEIGCDIRSVNGRSLDIKLRLPAGFEALEVPLRKRLGEQFARGNLQVTVNASAPASATRPAIDSDAFRTLARQAADKQWEMQPSLPLWRASLRQQFRRLPEALCERRWD